MACTTKSGVAPFIGFVADSTGETISQKDWHDLRGLCEEMTGEKLSREVVDQEEALQALDALASSITGNTHYKGPVQRDMQRAFRAEAEGDEKKWNEAVARIAKSGVLSAKDTSVALAKSASKASVKAVKEFDYAKAAETAGYVAAKSLVIAGKVTRGTIAVIRFLIVYGVAPALEIMRERRERQRRIEAQANEIRKAVRKAEWGF